jgi:hypothetical protein
VSLETVSTKNNRVYRRAFDHDEARRLRADDPKTWTHAALGRYFDVSPTAVERVLKPQTNERMLATAAQSARDTREPCKGGCGALVWRHGNRNRARSGYCPTCRGEQVAAPNVHDTELRCTKCGEWKPDDEFSHWSRASRRGRKSHCRVCESAARADHRRRTA